MPKPLVMSGFRRRRDFAKARDALVRLCVDAPRMGRVSLKEAARRVGVSPARAWRVLEPVLYARWEKANACIQAVLPSRRTAFLFSGLESI